MNLVSIDETRLVKLLMMVRPQGQIHIPSAIEKFSAEFGFRGVPDVNHAGGERGLVFTDGLYKTHPIDVSIYSDGVVLTAKSPSKILDELFQYIIKWAEKELDVQFIKTHDVDTFYESKITVQSSSEVLSALSALTSTRTSLKRELKEHSGYDADFVDAGLTLAVDTQVTVQKPSVFRVERKAGINFSYNYYFSTAPLPTDSHLRVLQTLIGTA